MSSLIGLACSHPCSHVRLFPCEPSGLPVNNHTSLPEDIKKTKYNSKYRLKAKKMAGASHILSAQG